MEPIMSKPKFVARKINDLKDMLEQSVALYSDKYAFIKKSKDMYVGITYKKYKEDVFGLGTELINRNIKGERVVILSENRYEWCVSFMAAACSEGIVVPASTKISDDKLTSLVNEVKAKFIIFSEGYRQLVKTIKKKCPTLEYIIDMDTIIDDKDSLSLLRLIDLGNRTIQNGDNTISKLEVDKNLVSAIFFEDTIIKDRGVMLSHKNLVSNIMGILSLIPINNKNEVTILQPISNSYQCICSFLTLLADGGTIHFSETDKLLFTSLKESNPNIIFLEKEILEKIYNDIWNSIGSISNVRKIKLLMFISNILVKFNIDIRKKMFREILKNFGKKLETIVVKGDKFNNKILKDFFALGLNVVECYELIEASSIIMINSKKDFKKENIMGLPLPGLKALVLNSNGRVQGEITLKGDSVMVGYYGDKKATSKVKKDEVLYTGRIGYRDKNGCFYLSRNKTK